MDLRVKKTRQSIRNAFIELRSKKPLERITVKELCERAVINKTTFYLHYQGTYELAESIENELIESCFSNIPDEDIKNADKLVREFYKAFSEQSTLFRILFFDNRIEYAAKKANVFLRERVFRMYPALRDDLSFNVRLTSAMYGCFYAYLEYKDEDMDAVIPLLGEIAKSAIAADRITVPRSE